jgi:hypothetical protein
MPHKEYNRLRKQRQLHQSHLQPLHPREPRRNCLRLSLDQDLKLLHPRREEILEIIRRLHHPTSLLPLRRKIHNTEDGIVIALLERIAEFYAGVRGVFMRISLCGCDMNSGSSGLWSKLWIRRGRKTGLVGSIVCYIERVSK